MPNRVIKDSIRTSKKINALTDFQFRLWLYLITYVDDYGRGMADPELLKGFVFPRRKRVTESDIEKGLADLAGMGCIHLYQVDGESYFCFPNWGEHQRIQNKRAKYPEPPTIENGNLPYSAANDDILPSVTVSHGEPPPESKPIQSESESETESKNACAFDVFWKAYPKKVGKIAAKKAFDRVKVPVETLLDALERQKCGEQWRKDNGQYIPNPATWLNQGRWEDEVHLPPKDKGQPVRAASYDLSAFEELALFGGGKG